MKSNAPPGGPRGQGHHGAKVVLAIAGGTAALALATVGGALSSAPVAHQMQPDSQFPVMAFDMAHGASEPEPDDIAGETIFSKTPSIRALAKADRMPRAVKLALAGSATSANLSVPLDAGMPRPMTYSVVTEPGRENETFVTPSLVLASLDVGTASNRFDQAAGTAPVGVMPTQPSETPEIAEEEDDAQPQAIAVPLPHAKPILDPGLPLPKMRPEIPPSMPLPNAGRIPTARPGAAQQEASAVANPGGITMRQPPPKPTGLLAFLTPQGDAPQPQLPQPVTPQGTILTPTPFGVPYVLQTQTVDTACLKPELLEILHEVETHYGRKVVITSGYRSRGREGSLHRTCRAADIIVPGVSSQALASYARTIPSVGGVGTYCHQSMIHVDIGTPRDWKYGCGSYFAMRDGTAHWGKLPASIQED